MTTWKSTAPHRVAILVAAATLLSCQDVSQCYWDAFDPPSATVRFRDSATGDLVCDVEASSPDVIVDGAVESHPVINYPELCQYRIPVWARAGDTRGSAKVTVFGYREVTLEFPVERDECDQIVAPPVQTVEIEIDPDFEGG